VKDEGSCGFKNKLGKIIPLFFCFLLCFFMHFYMVLNMRDIRGSWFTPRRKGDFWYGFFLCYWLEAR
jgi:hypothetical protein